MKIRAAEERDSGEVARVHVASWQKAYAGLMPEDLLSSLDPAARADQWRGELRKPGGEGLVAIHERELVGFSYFGRAREMDAGKNAGEVYAIYVHPSHWRRGFGRELLSESLLRLRVKGFETVTLWVLEGNQSARRFYRAMGFVEDGGRKERPGTGLLELRYVMLME